MALLDERSTFVTKVTIITGDKNGQKYQTKTFLEKMKCNVRLMIDGDVTEKKNENKVYRDVLNTYDH